MVIVGHAYALLALPGTPVFFRSSISTYAVKIFFVLSGYLVVKSWVHDPNLYRFIAKRALRILPALFGVVFLSAFVLGPFVTSLTLTQYFSHPHFWSYFSNLVLYISYSLPGVFSDNIYPHAVNGSLWSLPAEVIMYISVIFVGFFSVLLSKCPFWILWGFLTILLFGLNTLAFGFGSTIFHGEFFYRTSIFALIEVAPYFMAGGCLYLMRSKVVLSPIIAAGLLITGYYLSKTAYPVEALLICITSYAVICFGRISTPIINQAGRFGDISYGVYLYGFPVAQLLSWAYGHGLSLYAHMLLTIIVSYLLAFGSWHLLEKRALRLKPRAKRTSDLSLA